VTDEQKIDVSKFDLPTDRDKSNTNVPQMSSIFWSSTSHMPAKEIHFEFTQTFPLSHSPMTRNEFAESFKRIMVHHPIWGLSCRGCEQGRLPILGCR